MCSVQLSGLHVAARDGQVAFLFSICTLACEDVNPRDIWGRTPLDHAIMSQQWGCAVLLLSQGGARPNVAMLGRVVFAAIMHDLMSLMYPELTMAGGVGRVWVKREVTAVTCLHSTACCNAMLRVPPSWREVMYVTLVQGRSQCQGSRSWFGRPLLTNACLPFHLSGKTSEAF